MSKMGQVYLELEEQANELGFESVEEALASGYTADYLTATLVKEDDELEAYRAQEMEKRGCALRLLEIAAKNTLTTTDQKDLRYIAKFIKDYR